MCLPVFSWQPRCNAKQPWMPRDKERNAWANRRSPVTRRIGRQGPSRLLCHNTINDISLEPLCSFHVQSRLRGIVRLVLFLSCLRLCYWMRDTASSMG